MDCYHKRDLNPITCHFTQKCKSGFERNENFRCRKTVKKTPSFKKIEKLTNNNYFSMNESLLKNSKNDLPKSLKKESPLVYLDQMKNTIKSESIKDEQKEEKYKRVFPINSTDLNDKDKNYIIFQDSGTGIMLADTLYKDGKMIILSKLLLKKYTQPPIGWYLSEKYDGLRGIWTGKELVSRPSKKDGHLKGKIFNYVPEWFINMLPKGISLDGELWLGRGKFQEISGLSNYKISKKITKDFLDNLWKQVKYMVYDIPHLNEPYIQRYEKLKTIINNLQVKEGFESPIQLSTQIIVNDLEHLSQLYNNYTINGAEGIILREPNSYYETKRSKLLLKMKLNNDAEAIVKGYILGTGKYKGLLGSLICELNNKTFHIGTGFNDLMRNEYNDPESKYYIPIGSIVNFGYMELTNDGIPRHPVYRGIRTDI